jgi:hypothetical protein
MLDQLCGPVDVQPDHVSEEVHEQQPDMRVLAHVAETCVDAVPPVLGVHQRPLVQHLHETRLARSERAVALAPTVGGGDEDHLLALHEPLHVLVEVIEHLAGVEATGTIRRAELLLEQVLPRGPRKGDFGV